MRLMVFSDVHANLDALEAVLHDAVDKQVHRSICLGDLVGYGPYPNECIERVRSLKNSRCIAGNHDVAVLWEASPYGMSPAAKDVILWTMDQLNSDNSEYLKSLPDRLDIADMTFVHANPYNPRGWRYVLDRKYALRSFACTDCQNLFVGHSHRPLVIRKKNFFAVQLQAITGSMRFPLSDNKRRIINCGSVGQARDKDSRACYLIYDTREKVIEFYRVAYDVENTIQAMSIAGLPALLGRRLRKGT